MTRYVKATEALSAETLRRVSEELGGREAYLWIPATRQLKRPERDRYIQGLREQGLTPMEIADRLLMNVRTVYRILSKGKTGAASQPSRDAGEKK